MLYRLKQVNVAFDINQIALIECFRNCQGIQEDEIDIPPY